MIKCFPIDFVRQILEQTLAIEHHKNTNLFGGKNQINIFSFYEQLKNQNEVNRFVETFRDLTEQQNRTGLIGNGVLMSPENPTITNLYSCLIIPFSYTCSMRCTLANRDQMLETINNLIKELKGSKVDIAQLNCRDDENHPCSKPFVVGTIGHNDGKPIIKNGDFIGAVNNREEIQDKIDAYNLDTEEGLYWLYVENENKLKVIEYKKVDYDVADTLYEPTIQDGKYIYIDILLDDEYQESDIKYISSNLIIYGENTVTLNLDNGVVVSSTLVDEKTKITAMFELENNIDTYVEQYEDFALEDVSVFVEKYIWLFVEEEDKHNNIIFPPEHTSFEKYKVSLSFDSLRWDEPRTLNAEEYCEISFGGSATLVSDGVVLGNDLLKVSFIKYKVNAEETITYASNISYLEPLELPSGNNINNQTTQLLRSMFLTTSHADSLTPSVQYTFIIDLNNDLLKTWFNYGRYGKWTLQESVEKNVSPNTIYRVGEIWSSWGNFNNKSFDAKIVGNIDIENTESDAMTITVGMQIVGN